ncbi:MAG: single-stranded-DNA-specific exonuclease RecJ [Clostridia bacterium]|nr:single-stranded-DNA-specific exonuclease RecJ [Clostridia bacterium]
MLRLEPRFKLEGQQELPGLAALGEKYPAWLAKILCLRGVDTPEKAEVFLNPSFTQLHDPALMPDMDKATDIIRAAVEAKKRIVVYGDYDVDGICATTIMVETLRDLGADPGYYIPNRHGEGYGMNETAVAALAQEYDLLITVDCGITNAKEVALAKTLGMQVIVTDHHQIGGELPPADAVLNPLREGYPFPRLCGAGVALKVTQMLLGMEGVQKRIEPAALATVADIVILTDENRVIVSEGLKAINHTTRPGLRALLAVAGTKGEINAGHIGFQLAPRLNAAGRLESARLGVDLLLSTSDSEAIEIAQHLEEANSSRRQIQSDITHQVREKIHTDVDFLHDRAIIIMGEGWESGVIGLAAGKICEEFHFPTIVLSAEENGNAVGSCRSIEGVNIHDMLMTCKDLFLRFGGHEMAAGLTIPVERVPELRRRLNLAIDEKCDPACYIPVQEYDAQVDLKDVTMDMVNTLSMLEPTGCGNPSPMLLVRNASIQSAKRVGKEGTHLKLSVLDSRDKVLKDGIGFGLGDFVNTGAERADILFVPDRNEFMGRVSTQLQVKAIIPAEGVTAVPGDMVFFRALLQEIGQLASNINQLSVDGENRPLMKVPDSVMKKGRGVLVLAHEQTRAERFAADHRVDLSVGHVHDGRGFNTLLCAPDLNRLTDIWEHIYLLDGDVLPGERAVIAEKCPHAEIHPMKVNPALMQQLQDLNLTREDWSRLYVRLRSSSDYLPEHIARDCAMTLPQVLTGLTAFNETGLAVLTLDPYALRLTAPAGKVDLMNTPLLCYIRQACGKA